VGKRSKTQGVGVRECKNPENHPQTRSELKGDSPSAEGDSDNQRLRWGISCSGVFRDKSNGEDLGPLMLKGRQGELQGRRKKKKRVIEREKPRRPGK